MTIQVGDKFPDIKLQISTQNGIESASTGELLAGKKVVLFAVPGAFTPTCSAKHLPGFIDRADEIRSKGVDSILCLSVNDAFVMDAWAKDRGVGDKLTLVADGSAQLTKQLRLTEELSAVCLAATSLSPIPLAQTDKETLLRAAESTAKTHPGTRWLVEAGLLNISASEGTGGLNEDVFSTLLAVNQDENPEGAVHGGSPSDTNTAGAGDGPVDWSRCSNWTTFNSTIFPRPGRCCSAIRPGWGALRVCANPCATL